MKFKSNKKAKFEKWRKFHSRIDYDKMVVDFTIAWANLMEKHIKEGKKVKDIQQADSEMADTVGISGGQFDFAASALIEFWYYGDEIKKIYVDSRVCPYCHGKADLNDPASSDFQVYIDVSDPHYPTINVNYGGTDYENTRTIEFCPMCGRKF